MGFPKPFKIDANLEKKVNHDIFMDICKIISTTEYQFNLFQIRQQLYFKPRIIINVILTYRFAFDIKLKDKNISHCEESNILIKLTTEGLNHFLKYAQL